MTIATSPSASALIDTRILGNMELREALITDGPYQVVQSDLISADDHDDLYSAVVQTQEDTFVKVTFRWNHSWDEVEVFGDDAGILAPAIVRPHTKTIVVTSYE